MLIKISVAVTLLRIAVGRPILKWIIWGLIGLTIIAALVFVVGIANICKCLTTKVRILLTSSQVIQSKRCGAWLKANAIFS
jgi:hypothetical protein